ncbi:12-(S)-hydroxy-5,8,10,14-eicosatetraenoic acid receptor [Saimiri boliviensis]|uniref:12-(S)-hydroxy-5,8,10,14-eicosatetraenoic acid receptor n=1 Tax=Saimiri boliviensis TaxID=27679 RepID=UPI00027F9EA1|nr:12-(S)-hydroxy-5,8,10,14-eicosatetraenoic acid receptor [Saimiri boliviensis boliviensis]
MLLPNCSAPSTVVAMAVGVLLALECGLGLLGNAVALWTFLFRIKVWKPYAVYLLNLALADLLLAGALPFLAAFYLSLRAWHLGEEGCRVLRFLLDLSRGVGVAFLAAVAVDRYLRVIHPRLRVNLLSPRAALGVSGLIWLLMVALTYPGLLLSEAAQNSTRCSVHSYPRANWADGSFGGIWQEALFFLQIALPFGLIVICNAGIIRALRKRLREPEKQRRLRRTEALVTVVVVLFALCFLPCFLARVLMHTFQNLRSFQALCAVAHTWDVTGSLTYLQSALNPVVYCFSSPTFRRSYRRVFHTLQGQGKATEPPGFDLRDSYS